MNQRLPSSSGLAKPPSVARLKQPMRALGLLGMVIASSDLSLQAQAGLAPITIVPFIFGTILRFALGAPLISAFAQMKGGRA
jgi:hypothetical protein